MSKTNKIFERIPVEIPDRSGFDLSHEVLTTAKTGTVVPVTHMEVLPGDTISMGSMMKVTLPPFAVPFMGRIDAELVASFIPYRLLWKGWQSFITQNNGITPTRSYLEYNPVTHQMEPTLDPATSQTYATQDGVPINVPLATISAGVAGPGSLANYLGVKLGSVSTGQVDISALPFLAYHKFCDDWIINDTIQKPFFPKNPFNVNQAIYPDQASQGSMYDNPHFIPFFESSYSFSSPFSLNNTDTSYNYPYDGSLALGSLRQRCWAKDYFTTATTRPQAGADSQVTFSVDPNDNYSGGFTIASLRAANSLQKWLERNNIAGTDYGSQILAHFGVLPPDSTLNRSVLLGRVRMPVMVGGVENNTGTGDTTNPGTRSPFGNTLGAAAGFGSGFDQGSLVDSFTAKEHGIIMVFFTLIPHAYYNTGIDRQLIHKYVGDFAWPEFAGIGDQPIWGAELAANNLQADISTVWGYQQRFVEYKHMLDRVTGLLSDGNNLDVYALQRGFAQIPALGSSFMEIPTDFLDQVTGVSTELSEFGCMVDVFFDAKALRVLPEYSIPHL